MYYGAEQGNDLVRNKIVDDLLQESLAVHFL